MRDPSAHRDRLGRHVLGHILADPGTLSVAVVTVFLAALAKGYSGFGFNLVAVGGLSLVLAPSAGVPIVLTLAAVSSIHLVPQVWKEVDWRSVWLLLSAAVPATAAGVTMLRRVPAAPMRVFISLMLLTAAVLLWSGASRKQRPGTAPSIVIGAASGLLNGSIGVAGPPVILFYLSSFSTLATARASLVAYFLGTDVSAVTIAAMQGIVTREVLVRAAILLPALALGIVLGNRGFVRAPRDAARRALVVLLMILAVGSFVRGLYEWVGL